MIFSSQAIAALLTGGILCIAISIAALIVYKIRNKSVPVYPFFVGCGVFIVFTLILEQLLHAVMLPIVITSGSFVFYTVYGALAAGVFEETGRFIAFKTVMKKQRDPGSAVMYGLGHGGGEAIILIGISFLSIAAMAVSVNTMGIDAIVSAAAGGDPVLEATVRMQIEAYTAVTFGDTMLSVFERIISITFHTAVSVIVFESARIKGKAFLFPVCIILHALVDVPAALYQYGVLPLGATYPIMIIFTAVIVYFAARSYKRVRQAEIDG